MDETLYARCLLLHEFAMTYMGDFVWSEFFKMYDAGIPLSTLVALGFASPTDSGAEAVHDTWLELCRILGVDPGADYESIAEMEQIGNLG